MQVVNAGNMHNHLGRCLNLSIKIAVFYRENGVFSVEKDLSTQVFGPETGPDPSGANPNRPLVQFIVFIQIRA